jgi:hypothetical protein
VAPIDRLIFAHTRPEEWRDNPGFNPYFVRAALPSVNVETQHDWEDRVEATAAHGRLLFSLLSPLPLNVFLYIKLVTRPHELGIFQPCFLRIALPPSEVYDADPKINV